jgi:hypothetical protein
MVEKMDESRWGDLIKPGIKWDICPGGSRPLALGGSQNSSPGRERMLDTGR